MSKSISAQQRGLQSEKIAAEYFKNRKFKLLRHRYQCPAGEIDLVMRSPANELALIEVKTVSNMDYLNTRLSRSQKKRLQNCLRWFIEKEPSSFLLLAVVNYKQEVLVLEEVFS